ncbi:MAG: hypothetical protein Q9204_003733 [Flavoplaca sp. TL-2023a]
MPNTDWSQLRPISQLRIKLLKNVLSQVSVHLLDRTRFPEQPGFVGPIVPGSDPATSSHKAIVLANALANVFDDGPHMVKALVDEPDAQNLRDPGLRYTILQTARGAGSAAIDGRQRSDERVSKLKKVAATAFQVQANLEQSFGSLDYCACENCNSVTSPAAHFVELLQFLRNNNLDLAHPHLDNQESRPRPSRNAFVVVRI